MTPEERLRLLMLRKRQLEMTHPKANEPSKLTTAEKMAINPLTRGVVAMGEPIVNLSELIMRGTGIQGEGDQPGMATEGIQKYHEMVSGAEKKLQPEEQYRVKAGRVGELIGNVVSPLYWAAPGMRGVSSTVPGRIMQGAEAGLLAGAGQGTDPNQPYWGQKIPQLGWGLGAGLAIPSAVEIGRGLFGLGNKILGPMFQRSREIDIDNALRELNQGNQQTVNMLRNAQPGQTSGQAIASANREAGKVVGGPLVSLEKSLSKNYAVSDKMQSVYKGQQIDRMNAIDSIAGTETQYANAIKRRTNVANKFYKEVEKSKKRVEVGRVRKAINGLLQRNPADKNMVAALTEINEKLDNNTPQSLYSLSQRVKQMMASKTPGGQNEFNVGILRDLKEILDTQIGKAEPAYNKARSAYAELSRPVNRMEVGRELKKALINSKESESATQYLNAVANAQKTIKKSTGFARYSDLGEILTEGDLQKIKRVGEGLLDNEEAKRMAANVAMSAEGLTGEQARLAPILKREVVIANFILKKLSDKAVGQEYQKILLNRYTDPQKLADVLSKPPGNPLRKKIIDGLVRSGVVSSNDVFDKMYGMARAYLGENSEKQ